MCRSSSSGRKRISDNEPALPDGARRCHCPTRPSRVSHIWEYEALPGEYYRDPLTPEAVDMLGDMANHGLNDA